MCADVVEEDGTDITVLVNEAAYGLPFGVFSLCPTVLRNDLINTACSAMLENILGNVEVLPIKLANCFRGRGECLLEVC